ncbi:MAG TPA: Gfo/Idh/MocA family oxidoreductase [Pirellulales bacterium]
MSKLRVAVVGVGHLGRIHARLLREASDAELVAVVDPSPEARGAVGVEFGVPSYANHQSLVGQIDAAVVAVPSRWHHAVAIDLLQHGIHVFVEKPMTLNVGDADELIAEAAARRLTLQVGHVERFNPALVAARPQLEDPKYIDAVRSGPFTCRSTDIGVVLDLMIHDIDVALSLVDCEVVSVEALGAAVLGPNEDWAQARLTFAGGCVANFFASRVDWQSRRNMHVVCQSVIADIDFAARQAKVICPSAALNDEVNVAALSADERTHLKDRLFDEYLPLSDLPVPENNALVEEQRDFFTAIREARPVRVSGEDGRRALDVAERILAQIAAHRWQGAASGAIGPRHETREAVLRGPHWKAARPAVVRRLAG